jgi:hypothetical protein
MRLHATVYDNYGLEAQSWLRGSPYLVHFPGDYIDAVPYHGRAYIIEAPMPAILVVPLLAFFDSARSQTLLSYLLTSLAAAAGWLVARRSGVGERWSLGLCSFLLVGTSLAFCGSQGDVWFIAHVGAAAFSLLAIAECLGSKRPWLALLWALCAAFCRYPMFLAVPAYAWALWPQLRRGWPGAAAVAATFAIPAAWYDYIRWGTVVDIGFTLFYAVMIPHSSDAGPAFGLSNLPKQINAFFLQAPHLESWPPFVVGSQFGTAITYTSPALVLAIFAPLRDRLTPVWWFATLCCAVPAFLYYGTGDVQDGARHALDFVPFLFALMALACARRTRWWYAVPIDWSIVYGLAQLWLWSFSRSSVT